MITPMGQAIKKAIEGGLDYSPISPRANPELLFLKPLFWKCLGKSLGWGKEDEQIALIYKWKAWQYYWHSFIDHLAEGKDIDSFFKELLNNK